MFQTRQAQDRTIFWMLLSDSVSMRTREQRNRERKGDRKQAGGPAIGQKDRRTVIQADKDRYVTVTERQTASQTDRQTYIRDIQGKTDGQSNRQTDKHRYVTVRERQTASGTGRQTNIRGRQSRTTSRTGRQTNIDTWQSGKDRRPVEQAGRHRYAADSHLIVIYLCFLLLLCLKMENLRLKYLKSQLF